MPTNVSELRPRSADSEKITINLGFVDLGQIDLMVKDGFYSNRTDFIRTAIRNQLDRHAEVVRQSSAAAGKFIGCIGNGLPVTGRAVKAAGVGVRGRRRRLRCVR